MFGVGYERSLGSGVCDFGTWSGTFVPAVAKSQQMRTISKPRLSWTYELANTETSTIKEKNSHQILIPGTVYIRKGLPHRRSAPRFQRTFDPRSLPTHAARTTID